MPLEQCKECKKEISSKAKQCQHCGAPREHKNGIGKAILILFFGYFVYECSSAMQKLDGHPQSNSIKTSIGPQLEVPSWHCHREHGYIYVRGEVKNISNSKLSNVMAVGIFRTEAGEIVKAEDALLDYNPIMPGQISAFSAGGTDNPEIKNCHLEFKYLAGPSVDFIDSKNK